MFCDYACHICIAARSCNIHHMICSNIKIIPNKAHHLWLSTCTKFTLAAIPSKILQQKRYFILLCAVKDCTKKVYSDIYLLQ
jgi:hypothetical protein